MKQKKVKLNDWLDADDVELELSDQEIVESVMRPEAEAYDLSLIHISTIFYVQLNTLSQNYFVN